MEQKDIERLEKYYGEAIRNMYLYDWRMEGNDGKWYQYVMNLEPHLRITYLVIVCNDQVLNGGFIQYFGNGYGLFAVETIDALKTIGAIDHGDLLQKALNIVNAERWEMSLFRRKIFNKEIRELFKHSDISRSLDILDTEYYLIEREQVVLLLISYYDVTLN
jgi:hypothetical protein